MDFVFIIGLPRTGSKIYATNLNRFSDIDIVSEMHYLAPWYIRLDFVRGLQRRVGRLSIEKLPDVLNYMYSGANKANFWKDRPNKGSWVKTIGEIKKEELRERLSVIDAITPEVLFTTLLEEHARSTGKVRGGAKTPMDISRTQTLMKWFPNALYLHITRDPRAIFASMVKGDLKRARHNNAIQEEAIRWKRFLYLCLQYRRAASVHRKYDGCSNYYLSRFEDVVNDTEMCMKRMCLFLKVEYNPNMLNPPLVDSNFRGTRNGFGMDPQALTDWKRIVTRREEKLIRTVLKREMRILGYNPTVEE